ncbi:MAG: cupin domain-containing protein [Pseudomonadota bacterium]|nr:cupin domain-containing protein [Pseudomonadota bacterium]
MSEIIQVGPLRLEFLASKHETGGSLDMFRVTLPPTATMPIAHSHRDWEETFYGLVGVVTVTLEGESRLIGPGETLFVRRGAVHNFHNASDADATFLSVLTPGVLGPEYFRELAAALAGGVPDPALMRQIMARHGLIPAP